MYNSSSTVKYRTYTGKWIVRFNSGSVEAQAISSGENSLWDSNCSDMFSIDSETWRINSGVLSYRLTCTPSAWARSNKITFIWGASVINLMVSNVG